MQLHRRDVIKSLILTGVTGAMTGRIVAGAASFASSSSVPALHVLVEDSNHDAAFIEGARASAHRLGAECSILRLSGLLFDNLARVEELLRSRQPVLALLGPSGGVLLPELARAQSLRLTFIGHHTLGGPDWAQRHHLTTVASASGLSTRLVSGAGTDSFLVTESPLGTEAGEPQPSAGFESFRINAQQPLALHLANVSLNDGLAAAGLNRAQATAISARTLVATRSLEPWAAQLGGALAEVAAGSWRPAICGRHVFLSRGVRGGERPEDLTSVLIQG